MKPAAGQPAVAGDYLLERRARLCRPWLPTRRDVLVDYGCGNGSQTLFFSGDFKAIHGVDITRESLDAFAAVADAAHVGEKLSLHETDGCTIPLPDGVADCVTSFEVLEHVADEAAVLAELCRILKPDGVLLLSVPNRWWIFETHGADLPLLPWNRVPLFSWLPTALHDRWARARIYTRRGIVSLLSRHGFDVLDAVHVTAPMDVVGWRPMQSLLRGTLFRTDRAVCPVLATSVLVKASRKR